MRSLKNTSINLIVVNLVFGALILPCEAFAHHWEADWWPTDGWDEYPYGKYGMHTASQAIENSQVNRNRGFGEGAYSCTSTRFIRSFEESGEQVEEHEVVCLRSRDGYENNYTYFVRERSLYKLYLLELPQERPGPGCPAVGNPVNVATGNKFQVEIDVSDPQGGLHFNRFYSFQQSMKASSKWRHRFERELENVDLSSEPLQSAAVSRGYSSRRAACEQGAGDIAAEVNEAMGGEDWQANYENGRCRLIGTSTGGEASSSAIAAVLDSTPQRRQRQLIRLHGANGSLQRFRYGGGFWQPIDHPGARLTELPDMGWRYESPAGRVEYYDPSGRLTQIVDLGGERELTLSYADSTGRLIEVSDQYGRSLQFTHSDGRLTSVTAPGGKTVTYSYGNEGQLVEALYGDGESRQYHYEDNRFLAALTGITDENGNRYASWEYDDQGRVVVSEHAGGAERTGLRYNADGSTTVTNPLGKETTYHFATINGIRKVTEVQGHPSEQCGAANKSYTYTEEGWMESKTGWQGHKTTFEYNDRGLVTRKVEAVGTPTERLITTQWHPEFRQPVRVTEPKRVIEYSYDTDGRLSSRQISQPN